MFTSSGSNISSNRSNMALMVKVQRVASQSMSILWESDWVASYKIVTERSQHLT